MIQLIEIRCPLVVRAVRLGTDRDWLKEDAGGPLVPKSLFEICACFEAHAGRCPHQNCKLNAAETVLSTFDPVPLHLLDLASGSDFPFSDEDLASAFEKAGVSADFSGLAEVREWIKKSSQPAQKCRTTA
jgi:hypothetical protein